MLFNIHHGQMRLRGGKMVYLDKSPKSSLTMQNYDSGLKTDKIQYRADKLGNIDVSQTRHIEAMASLGYPVYNGDGKLCPVPMDDLLFPKLDLDSEYFRKIQQGLNLRRKG